MTGLFRQGVHRLGVASERARFRFAPTPGALDREDAQERLEDAGRVLFLCHGNICRSPLAERYARSAIGDELADVTVDSAGFVDADGRESPRLAVETAREYGVDLRDHRSTRVTEGQVAESAVLVVMDARNFLRVRSQFPAAIQRTYLLPAFEPEREAPEIADPHGADAATFHRVYGRVVDGVEGFVATLRSARSGRIVA